MVDQTRQVPAPAAAGWLFDLSAYRGPIIVILRQDENDAVSLLARHLLEIGAVRHADDARELIDDTAVESVGVVW
jgi:hypothetical protein